MPVIGDLMTARWSFEAMAVEQFKNNKYEKNFFEANIERSRNNFYVNLVDKISLNIKSSLKYKDSVDYVTDVDRKLFVANKYIDQLSSFADTFPGPWRNGLTRGSIDSVNSNEALKYLTFLKKHFSSLRQESVYKIDEIANNLEKNLGTEQHIKLEADYKNLRMNDLVLEMAGNLDLVTETGNRIIPKAEPGYTKATSKFGRAHYYAPYKQIGNLEVDTYWFNFMVIWSVSILMYLALYFNLLRKILTHLENLRFQKSEN